jgi:aspartate/methionine/tyrosine aminotransferase
MNKAIHLPLNLGLKAQNLPVSATLAINELIAEKEKDLKQNVLHMGFGEAAFPLHPLLKKALSEAATATKYAPVLGIPELRKTIAEFLSHQSKSIFKPHQIVVGPGSKALLYGLFQLLEGDVLLPAPSWVSYAPIARMAGKKVIPVYTDSNAILRLSVKNLNHAVEQAKKEGAHPHILIVNSPNNPTGFMFSTADVKIMAEWSRKHNITLISDEIYAELTFGWRKHITPATYYPEGTIITGGLSKAFSAGGWRLGYAAIPDTKAGMNVTQGIRSLGSAIWSSTATPIQKAAIVAFSQDPAITQYVHQSALVFGYVTTKLYNIFKGLGVPAPRPAGGFYLYPDFYPWRSVLLKRGVRTSKELAYYLLEEWNIATLPASEFNEEPNALRIRLSTNRLCEPAKGTTAKKREEFLWNLLHTVEDKSFKPDLPMLTFAQERWTKVIASLNEEIKH